MSLYGQAMTAIDAGERDGAEACLELANEQYYSGGDCEMTDAEFDHAQREFETKFGVAFKTRHKQVGRTDRHAATKQDYALLAGWLAKAQGKEKLLEWIAKTFVEGDTLIASPKYDGMCLLGTYAASGDLKRMVTRGDDGLGVDVTRMFAGESHWNCPPAPDVPQFGVKFEIVMRWCDLDRLNEERGESYKNPRNTVAGLVASDDSRTYRAYVTLAPLDVEWEGAPADRLERLEILDQLISGGHFYGNLIGEGESQILLPTPWEWVVCDDPADVASFYDELVRQRTEVENEYMIDGMVVELGNAEAIERLGGRSSDCPDYAVAAKFPHLTARTKAVSLDWDLGNSGRLTPVVNFEPIVLNGNTYSRTSIANVTRFDELRLGPGSPLIFELRNDVLGWLTRGGEDPAGCVPFAEPEHCRFTHNDQGQRVFAYAEAPLDGRCERMMVKCGVKGVRIETITKLVNAGIVTKLADMWSLGPKMSRMVEVPGLGDSSSEAVVAAIDSKLEKGLWDWEILASAGITGVGRTLSKEALRVLDLEELLGVFELPDTPAVPTRHAATELLAASIGPERARMVVDGVDEYRDDIRELMALAINGGGLHTTKTIAGTADGPKYKLVVTGDLDGWERDAFRDLVESMGHKVIGSVSSKTDFLVTNTPNSGTVKNKRAQELGVRIVTEKEIIEILGLPKPTLVRASAPGADRPPSEAVSLDDL